MSEVTYSKALTDYYRKLLDGGIPEGAAEAIVVDAARCLHNGELALDGEVA